MYLGDALGAFTEFLEVDEKRLIIITGFMDLTDKSKLNGRDERTQVGGHTDVQNNSILFLGLLNGKMYC